MHEQITWHDVSVEDTRQRLDANLHEGLSAAEVSRRRDLYGPNRLTRRKRRSEWVRFLLQFHSPLLYILLAAALVTALLQEWVDASVVFGVVLVNAIVGYLQEAKAEKAVEALSRMVRTEATVRRDGRRQRIPSAEIVPGDVVLLQSGDSVAADLRLFDVRSLQIEEASLTGESVPVQKAVAPVALDAALGDRTSLAFAGTFVTYGQGEGLVCATGDRTEIGRIAMMISEAVDLSTPLTRKIAQFSRVLLYVILGLAALTFIVGVFRGEPAAEMFLAAVALAVGAIPEGLPAAVTITLAIGVSRMARRRAIIRKMPAVETLGSTTVICSDKTGTLTENQMTVSHIHAGGQVLEVTGGGYEPHGAIRRDGRTVTPAENAALGECLRAGLLCNDSQFVRKEGRLHVEGDPTEAALIVAAQKAGLDAQDAARRLPRVDVIPFESERMFMATLHRDAQGGVIYVKGSVERLIDRCDTMLDAAGGERAFDPAAILPIVDTMAGQGLRVLAFARRRIPAGRERLAEEDVAGGFTLLGLQGMIDPPRTEAIRAVAECQNAGIQVKMITGDHKGTAVAVADQLGLRGGRSSADRLLAITGQELAQIPDDQLAETAERTAVFARVAPEQKLRLVRALQSRGHVVAMTGDGVNDAPALKQADIGVAMGITGTDVSKGAADMILADDNFASIEAAVEEGRNVFDNLTKFIAWTMPTNGGEGLLILVAILLGASLPALPVQFLWVNMTTALLLGLMLVFEPQERDLMRRPPRAPAQPILTPALLLRILLVSLFMTAGGFALFLWEQRHGASLAEARTAVVNVIVAVETFYLLNCRSLTRSFFALGLLTNPWVAAGAATMAAVQLLFTYAPFMNRLFHSAPISGTAWLRIVGVGLLVFVVIEIKKWLGEKRPRRPA